MAPDLAFSIALAAGALVTVAAYGTHVSRRGVERFARVERAGGSLLLGKGVMQMGYWAMRPVARACIALGITANAASWSSLFFGAAAGFALAFGRYGAGAALSLASSALDGIDGMIARETRTASEAGEVLDATVDRYVELFFFAGIAIHERDHVFVLSMALAACAAAVMVSYATAKAESLRVVAPRGVMRRQERAVYVVLGTALVPVADALLPRAGLPFWVDRLPLIAALGLVAAVGNVSAILRLRAVAAALRGGGPGRAQKAVCADERAREAHDAGHTSH